MKTWIWLIMGRARSNLILRSLFEVILPIYLKLNLATLFVGVR